MMKSFLKFFLFLLTFNLITAQNSYWRPLENKENLPNKLTSEQKFYSLNLEDLKNSLASAPSNNNTSKSSIIVNFPDQHGKEQSFRIYQQSNFPPELEKLYPEIKSYYGESTEGKSSKIYFSISPLGLSCMQLKLGESAVFIEPTSTNNINEYKIYSKKQKNSQFLCNTQKSSSINGLTFSKAFNANDGLLRTYRLALSCTGEYAQYFGGTKALALAAMNNTLTRVNGVFENDFSIRMVLIPQQDNIIFLNPNTDPYSEARIGANGQWNAELLEVLHGNTYGIGDAAFDVGHLLGASGGGGNAGCIGCVCNNNTNYDSFEGSVMYKGQGFSSPADNTPKGDAFDIDYVAHEIGHQFGANHTFTNSPEGTDAQVEPGSGSTIMGYAGITTEDVQANSDPYFHAISIQQVTSYIKSNKGNCSTNTTTGNIAPTADAGLDYTIPKETPFVLTGKGSDSNGDTLTYTWEQMDVQNTTNTNPSATKIAGPVFRSFLPTSSPVRYFPKMSTILAGETKTMRPVTNKTTTPIIVEVLPSVKRSLNFRLTARDNKRNGGANASDNMVVNIDDAYGPLKVTSQNKEGISYPQRARVFVTWDVAQTNVLSPNVDILFTYNGGNTWTTLLAKTPNDGSQVVIIPQVLSKQCRFMVKANGNIFFNVNLKDFEIIAPNNQEATIAPNPVFGNILTIKNRWDILEYEIYDSSGRLIRNKELINNEINVSDLIPGVYILKLDNQSIRFIKP